MPKKSRAAGASLLPQAVGGSAKRLEPTRVTFVFPLYVFPGPIFAPSRSASPSEQGQKRRVLTRRNPPQNRGLQPRLGPKIRAPSPMSFFCQPPHLFTKVMAPHSTPLPPQCAQSYLAVFIAGLGILIIGGKEEKSPDSILNRRPPMGGLFPFPEASPCSGSSIALHRPPRSPPGGPPAKTPLQRALVAIACHSPKEPSANPRGCNHLPQSQPQGGPPSAPNEVLLMRTNASFQEIHSCASRN